MAERYKKITKDDINFPKYCLFFIENIQEKLNESTFDEKPIVDAIVETTHPYCSDAFDLIMKTFERKGIDMMTPTFKMEYKLNVKHYTYKFKLRKLPSNIDNLPF